MKVEWLSMLMVDKNLIIKLLTLIFIQNHFALTIYRNKFIKNFGKNKDCCAKYVKMKELPQSENCYFVICKGAKWQPAIKNNQTNRSFHSGRGSIHAERLPNQR